MKAVQDYKADPRYQAYLADKATYGDFQEGDHKGFHWYAYRGGSGSLDHWCGSVDLADHEINESLEECLEVASHYGITGGYNSTSYGFDCAHWGDYVPKGRDFIQDVEKSNNTEMMGFLLDIPPDDYQYRDFPYIKSCLYAMINDFIEASNTNKN